MSHTRRDWLKNAATLIGGATAMGATGSAMEAAAQTPTEALPAPAVPTPRIVVAPSARNIVETTAGKVRGYARNGIFTFKGMPYAASTAGAARFMAPQKVTPWAGVRSSMALGFACPQGLHVPEGRRVGWTHDEEAFMFEWDDGQPGEDCLRVNVWTPGVSGSAKRPVMVWIHGGGYTSGSSNELRMYDGESLARRGDVVVVSLNHRLGALGYMNLLEYGEKWANAVNVGQLDLIAALEWVRDNISRFGGDPTKIMIFGQSGGGNKVGTLMGMPAAKGLFHRAAAQSGSALRQLTPDRSSALAAATLQELGLTRMTLDKLQDVPVEAILSAGLRAQRRLQPVAPPPGTGGGLNWGPTVDGRSIPRHAWDPAAPEYSATVPLLVGSVLNEFGNSIQAGDPTLDAMSLDEARKRVSDQRGARAPEIVALFQRRFPKASPYELLSRVTGMTARTNVIAQATLKADQRVAPAYVYWFQWQTPVLDGRPRAYHCSELPFVFANTDRCAAMTGGGADARALASRIADAWIAFARTGKPAHAGLPAWPAFSPAVGQTMVFDTVCAVKNNPDKDERDALRT
ncbi:MAG: carboxylesterase/lipase family protein [Acidobacteriota bacterium]